MGKCGGHPERDTHYHCLKHDRFFCQDCLRCVDPELYCKFRTSCTIWFEYKEKLREERRREEG